MVNSDTSEPPLSLGDNLNDPPRSQTYPLGASSPPSQKLHESTDSFETGDTGSEKDLSASTVDTTPSASYYLTYPVSYAMSGILRRLGSDPVVPKHGNSNHSSSYTSTLNPRASHSYSNGLDASYASSQLPSFASGTNGSSTTNDGLSGVYTPPHRHASPFEPPPLTPLSLAGYKGSTKAGARLLSRALAEEIRLLVPPRLQLVDRWALLYSLEQDGVSLGTLYGKCKEYRGKRGGFVLVVRDRGGGTFGAYLSDAPHPAPHFYGTGECFLWRASILPAVPTLASLPPPPSEDTTHLGRMTTIRAPSNLAVTTTATTAQAKQASGEDADDDNDNDNDGGTGRSGLNTPDRIRFKAFPYSGVNDYVIFCERWFLSVGGGDGHYGLWLNDNLEKGVSSACPTFGNEALSDDGSKFDVLGVEMWYVGV